MAAEGETTRRQLWTAEDSEEAEEGLEPSYFLHCHLPVHRLHVNPDDLPQEGFQHAHEESGNQDRYTARGGREAAKG